MARQRKLRTMAEIVEGQNSAEVLVNKFLFEVEFETYGGRTFSDWVELLPGKRCEVGGCEGVGCDHENMTISRVADLLVWVASGQYMSDAEDWPIAFAKHISELKLKAITKQEKERLGSYYIPKPRRHYRRKVERVEGELGKFNFHWVDSSKQRGPKPLRLSIAGVFALVAQAQIASFGPCDAIDKVEGWLKIPILGRNDVERIHRFVAEDLLPGKFADSRLEVRRAKARARKAIFGSIQVFAGDPCGEAQKGYNLKCIEVLTGAVEREVQVMTTLDAYSTQHFELHRRLAQSPIRRSFYIGAIGLNVATICPL